MKNKIIKSITLIIITNLLANSMLAKAYTLNGYKFSSPGSISYSVEKGLENYNIDTYIKKWCNASNKIGFKKTVNNDKCSIPFYGINIDNGTYGVTRHKSNNFHSITFFKAFYNASVAIRNEVIVHEVGHTLGLSHPSIIVKPEKSVMRATGFNGKAYPLSDDIAGIKKLYN